MRPIIIDGIANIKNFSRRKSETIPNRVATIPANKIKTPKAKKPLSPLSNLAIKENVPWSVVLSWMLLEMMHPIVRRGNGHNQDKDKNTGHSFAGDSAGVFIV